MQPTTTTRHPDDTDDDLPEQLPLRVCPWCGQVPLLQACMHHGFIVSCDSAPCQMALVETRAYDTREQAAEAWNTRTAA